MELATTYFRQRVKQLRREIEHSLYELATALYRVNREKLWKAWGYRSFIEYVLGELEMSPKTAYEAITVYEQFQAVWPRAHAVAWNRLLEATPLLTARKRDPEALVNVLREPESTVRAIRRWKDAELRAASPLDAVPTSGESSAEASLDEWITRHPDIELCGRWKKNGADWIVVKLTLPRDVHDLFVQTLTLSRRLLGIERDPDDDRWTLPRELEALCQEVAVEWAARIKEDERR